MAQDEDFGLDAFGLVAPDNLAQILRHHWVEQPAPVFGVVRLILDGLPHIAPTAGFFVMEVAAVDDYIKPLEHIQLRSAFDGRHVPDRAHIVFVHFDMTGADDCHRQQRQGIEQIVHAIAVHAPVLHGHGGVAIGFLEQLAFLQAERRYGVDDQVAQIKLSCLVAQADLRLGTFGLEDRVGGLDDRLPEEFVQITLQSVDAILGGDRGHPEDILDLLAAADR